MHPEPTTYWLSLESLLRKFPFDKFTTEILTEKIGYNSRAIELNKENSVLKDFNSKMSKYYKWAKIIYGTALILLVN